MAEFEDGGWRIATLNVDIGDATTTATLSVLSPLDVITTPAVSTSNGGADWASQPYQISTGEWREKWTVTGNGENTKYFTFIVAPDPFVVPGGARVYATTVDYANHLRASTPAGARRALHEASRMVDEMLLCAIYAVDTNGLPTAATVIRTLRDATCLQAEFAASAGDKNVVGAARPASFTLGRLSVQRGWHTGESPGLGGLGPRGEWSPRAWAVLQSAGLTGTDPITG